MMLPAQADMPICWASLLTLLFCPLRQICLYAGPLCELCYFGRGYSVLHISFPSWYKIFFTTFYSAYRLEFWDAQGSSLQWRIQDFPDVGAPTLGGRQHTISPKFSPKLHEIEIIWTPGWGRTSKILLCRSATALNVQILVWKICYSRGFQEIGGKKLVLESNCFPVSAIIFHLQNFSQKNYQNNVNFLSDVLALRLQWAKVRSAGFT